MAKVQRKYDKEFKAQAVKLAQKIGSAKADKEARKSDDLIKRDFTAERPLEKCVTDMMEVKASDGKLYISAIFDCYDLTVLGLAMDTNISNILSGVYLRKYGKWTDAVKTFVEYINNDETEYEFDIKDAVSTSHKTSKDINLRMRLRVMQRDNFKCCFCGASPAKDSSVELHIDHIKPWSKGGETVIENLQTFCSKCNLGKSDLE